MKSKKHTTRVVFTCPVDLAQKLTEEAMRQGISKTRLIVEILQAAMGDETLAQAQLRMMREMEKKIDQIWKWYLEESKKGS